MSAPTPPVTARLERSRSMWVAAMIGVGIMAAIDEIVFRRRERLGRRWSGWRTAGFLLGTVLVAATLSPRR